MLKIRHCLVAASLSSALACDAELDAPIGPESIEARSGETGPTSSRWWARVVDDPSDLVFAEDLDLHIVIDPNALPKDIAGVGEATAMVEFDGPVGVPLKIKLKIVVLPAGPTAD